MKGFIDGTKDWFMTVMRPFGLMKKNFGRNMFGISNVIPNGQIDKPFSALCHPEVHCIEQTV